VEVAANGILYRLHGLGVAAQLRTIQSTMDEWSIKTPNPICRLFFKLTYKWLCGILFNRFYRLEIYSLMVGIFDPACELLPPWTKEQYLCTVCPSTLSLTSSPLPPLPKLNVQFIQTVCDCGGGGIVELYCGPYSAWVLHSVSDQSQNLQNCFITPNKKDDIKGLVSLKFLRPCCQLMQLRVYSICLHQLNCNSRARLAL
jgi:hypothetical protein